MRILIYDHAGHPFQVQLSRQLSKRGHKVIHSFCGLLQTPHGKLIKTNSDSDNFEIFPVLLTEAFNRYNMIKRIIQEKQLGKKLIKKLKQFKPHVVVSSNTPIETQSLIQKHCLMSNIKFVFWLQDVLGIGIKHNIKKKIPLIGNLIGDHYIKKEKKLLKKSDDVIAISEDFLSFLSGTGAQKNKLHVIHNWAPLDELPLYPKSNQWSRLNNLENSFCFIYSGTLGMKHNPELLKELALKFQRFDNVKVVVVSEGLGADSLKAEKQKHNIKNLILLPFQSYDKLPLVLGSADVLIGILEKEAGTFSVPSKILTYLCMKKPLLLAMPQENLAAKIVETNKTGFICEPDDVETFLKTAEKLFKDKELRDNLAFNGYAYSQKTFDIDMITDRFEKIMTNKD